MDFLSLVGFPDFRHVERVIADKWTLTIRDSSICERHRKQRFRYSITLSTRWMPREQWICDRFQKYSTPYWNIFCLDDKCGCTLWPDQDNPCGIQMIYENWFMDPEEFPFTSNEMNPVIQLNGDTYRYCLIHRMRTIQEIYDTLASIHTSLRTTTHSQRRTIIQLTIDLSVFFLPELTHLITEFL